MIYPVRKNPRLSNYDYSSHGAYFLTVCTKNRKMLFSRIHVGAIHESPVLELTQYGKVVNDVIQDMAVRFSVRIDQYVIMPNHIHLLIFLDGTQRAIPESPLHKRSVLSKAVGYFKMNVSKQIHEMGYAGEIWQRSYHDHIIRSQQDYGRICSYIAGNPINWEKDCFFVQQEGLGKEKGNVFVHRQ